MRLMVALGVCAITPWLMAATTIEAIDIGLADLVVERVRGEIGQSQRLIAIDDNVFAEEVIETDSDSAARLVFLDGTELSLGASSRVLLDRFVYDPNAGTGTLLLTMVQGAFRFVSGTLSSQSYGLRTPFATLAIRGTTVGIDLFAGAVFVQQGTVELTLTRNGRRLVIEEGMCLLAVHTANPFIADGEVCARAMRDYASTIALLAAVELERAFDGYCAGRRPPVVQGMGRFGADQRFSRALVDRRTDHRVVGNGTGSDFVTRAPAINCPGGDVFDTTRQFAFLEIDRVLLDRKSVV